MPTLKEWQDALWDPREVRVESSEALLSSIRTRRSRSQASSQAKGSLAIVKQCKGSRSIPVAPIQLLHRLGLVTTPVVPNLSDICSYWAYIRYLWAFAMPDGTPSDALRLSDAALALDFHQKALMSEQFGMGMAALVMERYFNASFVADVSLVANTPNLPVRLATAKCPDFLFSDATGSNFYVVECKGTRCSRYVAVSQLCRGIEQVQSFSFTDGRQQPTALVIATRVTGRETEVFMVDPPRDGDDDNDDDRDDKLVELSLDPPRERMIKDPDEFSRVVRMASNLKRLSYAGSDQMVREIAMRNWSHSVTEWPALPRQVAYRVNKFGNFVGVEQTLRVPAGVLISVFQGIQKDLAIHIKRIHESEKPINNGDLDREYGQQSDFEKSKTSEGVRVCSVSADGTILEILIRED